MKQDFYDYIGADSLNNYARSYKLISFKISI